MAKFLETQAISNELTKLIKDAKERIILVSPYLKVNSQIQERLKTKSKVGTLSEIVIVYGKSELKKTELEWIKDVEDVKVIEKINLHAKCYINEEKAIICSMNLYDYSQQNNIEMGILITKESDREAYDELMDEINNIKVNGIRKNFVDLEKKGSEVTKNLNRPYTSTSANSPNEFKTDLSGLIVGMKVEHPTFGIGQIHKITKSGFDDILDINFSARGSKTVILRFTPLRIIDTQY